MALGLQDGHRRERALLHGLGTVPEALEHLVDVEFGHDPTLSLGGRRVRGRRIDRIRARCTRRRVAGGAHGDGIGFVR